MNIQNLTGQTIGQYQIRALLGAGGMGAVYRAYQATLKREVAFKILPPEFANQGDYAERFVREAQTAASLEHSHIVPIFDYGTLDGVTFVVMRLLNGGTLTERLKRHAEAGQPLPSLAEIADILKQLASALDYAHSKGIIHRDIKASNVMFDNLGSAFLVDFGIAKLLDATAGLTQTGASLGTPSYMAPEQWRGGTITPAADQYALGVLVYALVTGHLPFEGNTPYALMHKHLNEAITPPQFWRSELPETIHQTLERAMSKQPEDRFPTVTAFSKAFENAITGREGHPTGFFSIPLPPAPVIPTQRIIPVSDTGTRPKSDVLPWYKQRLVWGIAVLSVLAVVFGIAVFSPKNNTTPSPIPTPTNLSDTQIAANQLPTPDSQVVVPPTALPSATLTTTLTATVTSSPSPTVTFTLTSSITSSATNTPTATFTETLKPEIAARQTYSAIQTLTATAWTATPTPNVTQTFVAMLATLYSQGLTETATLWTPTSTPTPTPTPTDTPTSTPTFTLTPTPTLTFTPTFTYTPTPAPSPTPMLTPQNQTFNGVVMVLVPAGCFMMGSDTGQANEQPTHQQCFSQPFWIDQTEVTNAQYGSSGDFTGDNLPREDVTWFEAHDFCLKRGARLPTEAEWEYAARGPDSFIYPWGDAWIPANLVWRDGKNRQTSSVGSRPAGTSWVGAVDMAGNVWEWTSSIHKPYPYNALDGRENDADTTSYRVIKGGSWDFGDSNVARAAWRGGDGYRLDQHDNGIGFRCARNVDDVDISSPTASVSQSAQLAFRTNRDGNWEIYTMNTDGSDQTNLTRNPADDQFPAWSPDGQQIAFDSNRQKKDNDIFIMKADGSGVINLTNRREKDTVPVWSPDGMQIAFVTARKGNWEIFAMGVDGNNIRNLTNDTAEDFTPAWSPDGSQILFHSNRDGNFEIYVMNADGSNVRRLTNDPADDFAPAWSPDGQHVTFQSNRDGDIDIYTMNADGSNMVQLTNNTADDTNPDWSPDGTEIAFASNRDGNFEVYIMNADGSNQRRITNNPTNDSSPVWRPVGNSRG